MASSDHIQPQQLKLFMTGGELKDNITYSGDTLPHETLGDMWDRKVVESKEEYGHGAGTYDSIQKHGWDPKDSWDAKGIPIRYSSRTGSTRISNGHHRVAAAADIEEKTGKLTFFPLEHGADPFTHPSTQTPVSPPASFSSKFTRYGGKFPL